VLSFLALNATAALVAFVLARAASLDTSLSRLGLATLCGYLIVVHALVLSAGLLGVLSVGGLAAGAALALVGAVSVLRSRRDTVAGSREATGHGGAGDPRPAALFCVLSAILAGVLWVWPHLFDATRLWIWDDYTYHMVYPTRWLREHAVAAVPPPSAFTMQAWYPLSAGLVAAWLMAPFASVRADALAWVSLTGALYGAIVVAGAAEALARLRRPATAWVFVLALVATSGRVEIMASSFSDADLALAAALFAAFVFALPRDAAERPCDVVVDAAYAAGLTGFALGVKVSAAIPALVVAVMLLVRARAAAGSSRGSIALGRVAVVLAVGWSAIAGYWYVRNVVHTGNPVYPARFLFWPGATFPETTLREYAQAYGTSRAIRDALAVYMDWPVLHASVAVIGLVGLGVSLLVRRRAAVRAERYFALGALAITVAMLVTLPGMPYSAGNAMTFRSGFVHWDSMRYVALVPLLGWTALASLLHAGAPRARWSAIATAAVTMSALVASGSSWLASPVTLVALALCARILAGVPIASRWLGQLETRRHVVMGVAAVGLATIVAVSHGTKASATAEAIVREPLFGAAAAVLDAQPAGTRVTVFGDQWIYPAFGARHHLGPVRVDANGRIATTPIGDAMTPGELTVDPATLRANLAASGVGVVVAIRLPHPGRSADRPTQESALATLPDARLLHRDAAVTVWRLGG
jgi:hypothetical protein